MLRAIRFVFKPLYEINKSLALLAKLYEADLASRTPPIFLITEEPHETDTEVFYGTEDKPEKHIRFGSPKDWFNKEVDLGDDN